jgi:hypothetical protein
MTAEGCALRPLWGRGECPYTGLHRFIDFGRRLVGALIRRMCICMCLADGRKGVPHAFLDGAGGGVHILLLLLYETK